MIGSLKRAVKATPGLAPVAHWVHWHLSGYVNDPAYWADRIVASEHAQVVQIGANDGIRVDPIHKLIKRRRGWRCLFVEPIPYMFERLKRNYGSDDRFQFANVAVNDGSHQVFYSVNKYAREQLPSLPEWFDQLGSFDRGVILKHLDGALEPYIEECEVTCVRLHDLLHRHAIDQVDVLHIDAEGYDWKILSQLVLDEIEPRIILFEHKHLSPEARRDASAFLQPRYDVFGLVQDVLAIHRESTAAAGVDLSRLRSRKIYD